LRLISKLVCVLAAVTLASGTTAPLESFTVPTMVAVDCPKQARQQHKIKIGSTFPEKPRIAGHAITALRKVREDGTSIFMVLEKISNMQEYFLGEGGPKIFEELASGSGPRLIAPIPRTASKMGDPKKSAGPFT
jgi:hypothetical protein